MIDWRTAFAVAAGIIIAGLIGTVLSKATG